MISFVSCEALCLVNMTRLDNCEATVRWQMLSVLKRNGEVTDVNES
jgi:hypothetical protein